MYTEIEGVSTNCAGVTFGDIQGQEAAKQYFEWITYRDPDLTEENPGPAAVMVLGPQGSGKDMVLHAVAGTLVERGYQCINLMVPRAGMLPEGFTDYVEAQLQQAPCVLTLRKVERLQDADGLLDLLNRGADAEHHLLVVASAVKAEQLDGNLAMPFTYVYLRKPNLTERQLFFTNYQEGAFRKHFKVLAEKTEDYGYAQLCSICTLMKAKIDYFTKTNPIFDETDEDEVEQQILMVVDNYDIPKQAPTVVVSGGDKYAVQRETVSEKKPIAGTSPLKDTIQRDASGRVDFSALPKPGSFNTKRF